MRGMYKKENRLRQWRRTVRKGMWNVLGINGKEGGGCLYGNNGGGCMYGKEDGGGHDVRKGWWRVPST